MERVKILLVGPCQAGKSTVANFLGEVAEGLGVAGAYAPTAGVRILEFEREISGLGRVPVELWDVSGDQSCVAPRAALPATAVPAVAPDPRPRPSAVMSSARRFEAGWPAVLQNAAGVLFMYTPGNAGHEREIELWAEWFAAKPGMDPRRCATLAYRFARPASGVRTAPPRALATLRLFEAWPEAPAVVREALDSVLAAVIETGGGPGAKAGGGAGGAAAAAAAAAAAPAPAPAPAAGGRGGGRK
jgi:Rab-like protein 5